MHEGGGDGYVDGCIGEGGCGYYSTIPNLPLTGLAILGAPGDNLQTCETQQEFINVHNFCAGSLKH